ncbi:MAG: SIMPL domain-containing protein [bacterium]|nr:SIMPL domain-containing protein [bacterium]
MQKKEARILGWSFIIGMFIFGLFFYAGRSGRETISVIGTATKRYESDIIKWRVTITRFADLKDMKLGYDQLKKDEELLVELLKSNGVDPKDITVQPVMSEQKYDRYGQQLGFTLRQIIFVISKDIPKVEQLALNPKFIIDKGIILDSANVEYYFSNLPEIKRELLALATQDAKKRAQEIAKNAGVKLDKLISARSGIFQINEPFSTEIQSYGVYNTATRQKDINITLNATYTLK